MKQLRTTLLLLALAAAVAGAQEALKSVEEEYYDFLALQGITQRPTLNYRTLSDSEWQIPDGAEHPWQGSNLGSRRVLWQSENDGEGFFTRGIEQSVVLKIYGPEWYNSYNSSSPYGQNDGALWQGKGYNTSLTGGARLEAYGFEVTLKPQISFSQNKEYDYMLPGVCGSEYSYFWGGGIDLVQRYGDSSFWTYDWGDTEVRYTWHTLTVGFGFQSPWLGPAWINPMLGSNNAGTYPKVDAGLRKTQVHLPWLHWYIGEIEARVWIGRLTESDYFDNDSSNDYRMLNALSLAYSPSFFPGLTLGINRIFMTNWEAENLKYFGRLFTLSDADSNKSTEDQKIAFNASWIFPSVGFEVYGELGIDDYTSRPTANPFHTAIYTVGAKKSFKISPQKRISGEIIFEWSNFEMSQDFQLQWMYMGYYSHGTVKQGYTQSGQIIGAGYGYAGNSQFIGVKIYYPKGSVMPYLHRSSPDNNYSYSLAVDADASTDADNTLSSDHYAAFKTYYALGISADFFITKSLSIYAEYAYVEITFPNWLNSKTGIPNYRFCFAAKYNF